MENVDLDRLGGGRDAELTDQVELQLGEVRKHGLIGGQGKVRATDQRTGGAAIGPVRGQRLGREGRRQENQQEQFTRSFEA